MGLLARATDYTNKDFDSLRLRLQSLARSVFPTWTDFNFGNILLELYAFVLDVVVIYLCSARSSSRSHTPTNTVA